MTRYFISVIFFILFTEQLDAFKYCPDDWDCSGVAGSFCKDKFCECHIGKILNTDASKCINIIIDQVNNCEDDKQCEWITGPSECKSKHCRCKEGFRYFKTECIPAKYVGDSCTNDADCNNGLFPQKTMKCGQNKKCECNQGYYKKDVFCRLISKENEVCVIDSDCPTGLACLNKVCKKKSATNFMKISSNVSDIEPRKVVVKSCTKKNDCDSLENSFCAIKYQTCMCLPGYALNKKGKCLLDIGEACEDDNDCASSICSDEVCRCNDYWTHGYTNEKCIKPYYDDHCSEDSSCQVVLGRNSKCNENCACLEGYKVSKDFLCEKDTSGGPDVTCSEKSKLCSKPNTVCDTTIGYCVCKENFHNNNGDCLPIFGGECHDDDDCDGVNMTCNQNVCKCIDNNVPVSNTKCQPIVNNIMDDKCEVDEQCHEVLNEVAICKDNKCQCPLDYKQELTIRTEVKYSCLKKRYFGDYCGTLNDCKVMLKDDHVQCRNNHCVCDFGYEMDKEELKCVDNGATVVYMNVFLIISSTLIILTNF